ncbi:MAG TPA: BTAD domain-containing putative transcriptional regulator [Longimicrobium sp.]|uniref:BTAD domain-containing putative transcriptional regulator n=1 Tax=Longimicrobium sp. TaxID=2029185 RepID=UPI002EDA5BB6
MNPPPELRILGALELRGAGPGAAALLARPKPLALLVYLAAAGPEAHPRESLVALLWPDADGERARASLRQAVLRVRGALGPDAVARRGETLGLAPGAVRCDAADFVRLAARGDDDGALAVYGGDLLPGFHVDGAPAFGEWLEGQRRALRARAASAALRRIDAAHGGEDALAVARRAAELFPDDEPVVRRLMAQLDRAGDRAGALRAYDALAERLLDGFGAAPSAETEALAASLRGAPAAALAPRRVRVDPFVNETGSAGHDTFGRLVCDSVAQAAAAVDAVDVVHYTADHPPAATPSAAALAAAEAAGAATLVTGSFYGVDGELVVHGWVTDVRSGQVVRGIGPVRAPAGERHRALDALRDEVRTTLALHLDTRITHVRAAARAPSYEAHSAYVEGLSRFVEGDWAGALGHFGRALERHPEYALALLVSAIAWWNLSQLERAEAMVRRAAPLVRHAGPFERALLETLHAWLAGDWSTAYGAVRRQAELAPGSIAACQVADEARRLNRPGEAVRILSAMDPSRGELQGLVFYWVALCQVLHSLREHQRELEAALRARGLFPGHPMALRQEVTERAALGDVPGVLACLDESAAAPSRQEPRTGALMREAAHELLAHGHDAEAAADLLARSLRWYQELPPDERARPEVMRATARARYDAGDLDGAAAAFAALAGDEVAVRDCCAPLHPHLGGHLDHGYLGVIAVRRGDAAGAARLDALLEGTRGDFLFGATHYWRAAMAVAGGEPERAVHLLRRAFAGGMPHEIHIHRDPHLAPLRGRPDFAALLAPRG